MSPRTELVLTIAVCAAGLIYFGWKAVVAEGNEGLTYIAFVIVGGVLAHRAIKDVVTKIKQAEESNRDSSAGAAGPAKDGLDGGSERPRGER